MTRTLPALLGLAVIAATATVATTAARPPAAPPRHLTVVELFQSQGCSDCPPANANLNALAARPDILALSYGVTYWDKLGWKDTFAAPQFTARQWDYARRRHRAQVWTPQIYVDGKADLVGSNRAQLDRAVAASRVGGPSVALSGGRVAVSGGLTPVRPATVWLVRYDPRTIAVPIRAGENGGRTLPHRNIVRALIRLGDWSGKPASYALPAGRPGLATAVLVQDGPGGAIVAAARG